MKCIFTVKFITWRIIPFRMKSDNWCMLCIWETKTKTVDSSSATKKEFQWLCHSSSEQSQSNVYVNFCEHKIYVYLLIYTLVLSEYEGWSSCLWKSFQVGRAGIVYCALEAFCCFSISTLVWRQLDLCTHLGERNLLWPFCSLVSWNTGCLESRSIYWESKWIFPRWEQLFLSSVLI